MAENTSIHCQYNMMEAINCLLSSSFLIIWLQVAKATLSEPTVMLEGGDAGGADERHGAFGDLFEGSVRDRFLAAAAVSPRFLLLDFRCTAPPSPPLHPHLHPERPESMFTV